MRFALPHSLGLIACCVIGTPRLADGAEPISVFLMTVGQKSHIDVQNSAAASANAKVAAERALDAANRANRQKNRSQAQAISQRVEQLSKADLSKWRSHSKGGKYYRTGKYEATLDPLGYRVRVIDGPNKIYTGYFFKLDDAIEAVINVTKDPWPKIPGTSRAPSEAESSSKTASVSQPIQQDASQPTQTSAIGKPPVVADYHGDLVWRYAGQHDRGEYWTDATGNYRILSDQGSNRFEVIMNGNRIASGLAKFDDAMAQAQAWSVKKSAKAR